jgi:hypothetical protein
MSDRDEPTEPSAPVTSEVAAPGEPEPSEAPAEPKTSVFAAVNARRVSLALVVIALVWLGAWAYSSGSSSTAATRPAATVAPAPSTSVPRHARRENGNNNKQRSQASTTTLAPPPNVARTAQAYATALIGYWLRLDRTDAYRVATKHTVNRLFTRRLLPGEQVTAQGCRTGVRYTTCTWASVRHQIVLQVQNPSGATPVLVVGATVTHL